MKRNDSYWQLIAILDEGMKQYRKAHPYNDGSCLYCLYAQQDDCPVHGWK